jgi:hypothetical protein
MATIVEEEVTDVTFSEDELARATIATCIKKTDKIVRKALETSDPTDDLMRHASLVCQAISNATKSTNYKQPGTLLEVAPTMNELWRLSQEDMTSSAVRAAIRSMASFVMLYE